MHLAGFDPNGDLVMFAENGHDPSQSGGWTYRNISEADLAPRGVQTPEWTSNLTAYVAPWNGLHISGFNSAGEIVTVWTAPGIDGWVATNVSRAADAPALHGRISSFVTPWGGLNVAGTDTDGNLVALWWLPGFDGQWRVAPLGGVESVRLDPDTITSYVTSWGGLNVAGLDAETGQAAAYWWTPDTGVWTVEAIQVTSAPAAFSLDGGLSSSVMNGRVQNLFGRDADGSLVRLFWQPGDGARWTYESVTEALLAQL